MEMGSPVENTKLLDAEGASDTQNTYTHAII